MEAIVLYSIFLYFWFHLAGRSDILAKPRAWFIRTAGPKVSYPLSCAYCWSFWWGVVFTVSPITFAVPALAMLFVAPVINLVLDLVVRKLRMDAEPPVLEKPKNGVILDLLTSWQDDNQIRERLISETAKSAESSRESGWKS